MFKNLLDADTTAAATALRLYDPSSSLSKIQLLKRFKREKDSWYQEVRRIRNSFQVERGRQNKEV